MLIPEKKEYEAEVKKINNEILEKKLMLIYDCLKGYKKANNIDVLVKEVLMDLFPNVFTKDVLVPLKFCDSVIGKVLFSAWFGNKQEFYTIKEAIEFTKTSENPDGFKKQYLSHDIATGKLKATKQNNRYLILNSDLKDYLNQKGISNTL